MLTENLYATAKVQGSAFPKMNIRHNFCPWRIVNNPKRELWWVFICFFFFFFFFSAFNFYPWLLVGIGSHQSLHNNHRSNRSQLCLQTTPQLTAMPDCHRTEQGQGWKPHGYESDSFLLHHNGNFCFVSLTCFLFSFLWICLENQNHTAILIVVK